MKTTRVTINGHDLQLEVAESKQEQKTGLMHRDTLDKDSGMLFVYKIPAQASFWMKNTKIPLSIAFIDENNQIFQIENMSPGDLKSIKSKKPSKYALEVNKGWFKANNISIGDNISFIKKKCNKKRTIKIKIQSV